MMLLSDCITMCLALSILPHSKRPTQYSQKRLLN
uniref:Uncharacterized protein n=1 Tax=Anguilla anguilla TaxID=7936 RepID=A0A0E9U857_ANGAN